MEYILLILAPLLSAFSRVPQKKYQERTVGVDSGVNIYLGINCIAGMIFFAALAGFKIIPNTVTLLFSAVFAGISILSVVVNLFAIRQIDIAKMAVFSGAGGIIMPIVFGAFFLHEQTSLYKWIAVLLLLIVISIPLFDKTEHKKGSLKGYLLCLLLFFDSGISVIICKLYALNPNVLGENVFCFWTNVFIVPFAWIIILKTNGMKVFTTDVKMLAKKTYLFGVSTVVLGNSSTLISMYVLKYVNVVVYTILTSSLSLISVAIFSRVFFKQKITASITISIVLSIMAIVLNLF